MAGFGVSIGSGAARGATRPATTGGARRVAATGFGVSIANKPAAAPKGGGNNESSLIKALNFLGKGKSVAVSGLKETVDLLQGRGFSGQDFRRQVNENIGYGDLIKDSKLPSWAKAGLGFVGDVALDPLTYVGGAGIARQGGAGVAKRLIDPEVAAKLSQLGVTKAMADEAAETAVSRGIGRINPEVLSKLGQVTGQQGELGIYFRPTGTRIPGSEHIARAAANANASIRQAVVKTGTGAKLANTLGGKTYGGFKVEMRKGNLGAFKAVTAGKAGDRARKVTQSGFMASLDEVMKPFTKKKHLLGDIGRALEGDEVAAGRIAAEGLEGDLAAVREWLDHTGRLADMPRVENYFPRQWSPELREEMKQSFQRGKKDVGPAMKRELVQGSEFLGQTLTGSTPAALRDEIEDIAKMHFGPDYKKMFNDDPVQVLRLYAHQAAQRVGQKATRLELEKADLIQKVEVSKLPSKEVRQAARLRDKAAKEVRRLSERAGKLQEAANAGDERARGQLDEVMKRLRAAERASLTPEQAALAKRTAQQTKDVRRLKKAEVQLARAVANAVPERLTVKGIERQLNDLNKTIHRLSNRRSTTPAVDQRLEDAVEMKARLEKRLDVIAATVENDVHAASQAFDHARTVAANAPRELAITKEANRLLDAAALETDPVRRMVATLEAHAAEAAELDPPTPKLARQSELQMRNQVQLHNVVADSIRHLVDNPDDLVDVLSRTQHLNTPQGMQSFLRAYDWANGYLKRYMIFTPGFHFRNLMGGEFNNFLAGVTMQSRREWGHIWRKAKFGKDPSRLSRQEQAIYDKVMSTGTINQTQASDVAEDVTGQGRSWNPFSKEFRGTAFSMRRSSDVEGYLRGSLAYHELMRSGGGDILRGSVDEATDAVYKFHFDYDDLSAFERGVVKRIIPFYTWTRKNLPLQLEQIAKQPAKYTAYLKAKDNIEMLSEEEEVVPGYFGDLMGIRMPWANVNIPGLGSMQGQLYAMPDLPFRDVAEYVNPSEPFRALDMAVSSVSPMLKLPVERWANKQYFSGNPFYEGYKPAPGSWGKVPGLLPALAGLGLAERGAGGKYFMDQRNAYSVEQLMPILARIRRMAPSGSGDQFLAERQATSILSTTFGLGLRSNTPEAIESERRRRSKELQAALRKQRDLGYVD